MEIDRRARYSKIVWRARKRYETKNGNLVLSIGGKPTRYAQIEQMAWDRHMKTGT